MNVLVTGATGFLGSHLVDACLRQGDKTRVIVRATSDRSYLDTLKSVEQVHGDLTSSDSLRGAVEGIDVVYHSAARVTDCRWKSSTMRPMSLSPMRSIMVRNTCEYIY